MLVTHDLFFSSSPQCTSELLCMDKGPGGYCGAATISFAISLFSDRCEHLFLFPQFPLSSAAALKNRVCSFHRGFLDNVRLKDI